MNDAPGPEDSVDAVARARDRLGHLNGRVEAMRAVLVQLLQDVVQAESCLERSQATQLLEANERLVVSALAAQTDADAANGALGEASRAGRLDPLTALPNRMLLLDRFDSAIANAKRHGNRFALLFLDLDAFKLLNDTQGHAAGDRALQLVADCLTTIVRETDTVSRHGGDEFLILLGEVASADDAAHVADKVNAALASYGTVDDREVNLTASIGISMYPDDGQDAKTLIERADSAMYRDKRQGPGAYALHSERSVASRTASVRSSTIAPAQPTQYELALMEHDQRNAQLRDANEALVLAALKVQEMLATAERVKARQARSLTLVGDGLNDLFAPIRVAVAALGASGAHGAMLARVQELIDSRADRMARMVQEALRDQGRSTTSG